MPNLKSYIRNTLSVHLSLWMAAIAALLFVAVLWMMLWFARQAIREEATEKARAALETAALTIDNELSKVETAARNMQNVIERRLDTPNAMTALSQQMVVSNPNLKGCNIAFRPGYYPQKGPKFMVYSERKGQEIVSIDDYAATDFEQQSWFADVVRSDSALWSDPSEVSRYFDEAITSYNVPIHEGDSIVGVLSVDVPLGWLSHTVQAARPFPNTFCALMSRNASFIVHPDSTMLGPGSIKKLLSLHPDDDGARLAKAMMNGERGNMAIDVWGIPCYAFYCPFENTGWSLDIICPEYEMFASWHQLHRQAMLITLVGLLALFAFCFWYVGWQLRPLFRLDASTQRLAKGDFSHLLEATQRPDEIGHLQRSFRDMQLALDDHLNQIAQQRQALDEQGEALRTAYEHTKEAEDTKRTFMHSATDQLTPPVTIVSDIVGRIYEQHAQLSHDEIVQMTDTMDAQSKKVTELLDRMINFCMNPLKPSE